MSEEYPTSQFPAYGTPGAPGAQPPVATPTPPPFGSVPPQEPRPTPGLRPADPGAAGSGPGGPDDPSLGGFPPGPTGGGPSGPGPRRSRRLTVVLIAAIVVVLGAGIGVAVAVGTDDGGTTSGSPSSNASGSQGAGDQQGRNGKKQGKHNVIRGTITAESGSTWTVQTQQGQSVKVTIGADTKFGTKQDAAKKEDFEVGEKVVVAAAPGEGSGDAVTARRVRELPANAGQKGGGANKSSGAPAPSSSPS